MKPTNLSVHRNTRNQRDRHRVSNALRNMAKTLTVGKQIAGFALVVWDEEWSANAFWDTGRNMPGVIIPDFTKEVIQTTMQRMNAGDEGA